MDYQAFHLPEGPIALEIIDKILDYFRTVPDGAD